MTPRSRTLVLYDAHCAFCIWVVSLFLRLDRRGALVPAPTQECVDTLLRDVPRDRVLASFHTVSPAGRVESAGAALATVMRAVRPLRPFGHLLAAAPPLADRLYWLVASRRARLATVVPESAKAAARTLVAQRAEADATRDPALLGQREVRVAADVPAPDVPVADVPVADVPVADVPVAGSPLPVAGVAVQAALATADAPPSDADGPPAPEQPPPSEVDVGAEQAAAAAVQPGLVTANAVAAPAPYVPAQPAQPAQPGQPAPPAVVPATPATPAATSTDDDAPSEVPTTTFGTAVRLIAMHVRPLRLQLAAGLLLLVLASLVGLGQPLATRYVLDTIGAQAPLRNAVLLLVGLVLAAAVCQGAGQYLMLRSAEDVVLSSRERLVGRLLDLSVSGMRSQEPGDLMARVTSDTALIRQIALSSLVQLITGGVVVIGAVVVMVVLDAFLFAVTAAVVAALGLLLGLIMPRIRHSSRETQRNVGAVASELERVLGAYTTVKAAGAEDLESERLGERVRKAHDSGVRTALWSALAGMTSALAVQAAFLVVLGVGGWRVQDGALSVATLIAFLLYAMQLSTPVLQLTQAVTSFQAGRAALERIAEVDRLEREAHPESDESEPSTLVPGSQAALGPVSWDPAAELVDVSFRYPDQDAPAVVGVSLTVPERGVTAIVGPSGSGKSSVLKLLEGFYPLESGTVRVAGRSLAEWDLGALRDCVAYVEQETPVFAGTLLDNLTYGQEDVADEEVLAALDETGLQERIPTLAEAEAEVGHRGSALSGGERQRLAIARALLRGPRLLLLDEATSQLDAANEARMRDLVEDLGRQMAVVLVAHRLSSVVRADQILVMADGRVRARGTHEQLLAQDELYRGLVEEQQQLLATVEADTRTPAPVP